MEPRIQYVKTSDGVNVAYIVAGSGQPVVWVQPPIISHVQLEWEQPILRAAFESIITGGGTLIRFDARGTGLSDRDAPDYSPEAYARDLEAVVDRLQLDSFSILAVEHGAVAGVAYAVAHPDRVSRLVLINPAWMDASTPTTRGEHLLNMADDWELLTESIASFAYGFEYDDSRRYAAFMRAGIDQAEFKRYITASVDLPAIACQLRVPTLVIRHSEISWLTMESTRSLVAGIPGATMTAIDGHYISQAAATARAIATFLGSETPNIPAQRRGDRSAFRAVLFTDLVGHTEMMSRLGDEKGREVLREHERITREVLKANGGTEIKTMGDGFMASFGSITKAVECAVGLQKAIEEWNAGARHASPLHVRVGLNAGEPIEEDGDLFGATVILASRIAAKADGGEILVADTVRGLCSGKGFLFSDRGEFVPKGFEEPVRLYEVNWRD